MLRKKYIYILKTFCVMEINSNQAHGFQDSQDFQNFPRSLQDFCLCKNLVGQNIHSILQMDSCTVHVLCLISYPFLYCMYFIVCIFEMQQ